MPAILRGLFVATALLACNAAVAADEPLPYSEGEVIQLSYIKVQPGQFDAYMRYLATTWKELLEEQKKAGLVTGYHVYGAQPRTPQEPDLILAIHYKNWAALDGLSARLDAMLSKKFGSRQQSATAAVDREKLRTPLGVETVQELLLR